MKEYRFVQCHKSNVNINLQSQAEAGFTLVPHSWHYGVMDYYDFLVEREIPEPTKVGQAVPKNPRSNEIHSVRTALIGLVNAPTAIAGLVVDALEKDGFLRE